MKSNFEFLKEYWPALAQIGETAENYLYSDPNACIYKIGLFTERLVQEIFVFEVSHDSIIRTTKLTTNFFKKYIETYNDKQNQPCYINHVIKEILMKYSFEL